MGLVFDKLWVGDYDKNMKIGVFDSGIGGTTILEAIQRRLPGVEYRYIADSENCPYGEKPAEVLYEIVRGNVEKLRNWGARIIVIACNTATVKCIDRLRLDYPELKFVGTEPAVKMALTSGAKKILVLATPNTIESERLHSIAEQNASKGQQVDFLACSGLAEVIEKNYEKNSNVIVEKLNELLVYDDSYEVVVLGCTHYPLISDLIQVYYPNAKLVDGADGVAKRVQSML